MKQIKSERLRKLESELNDLEEWLKLGLVPKKDITKHKDEIQQLKTRIDEEKERLQFLKEGGEAEEFIAPKRIPQKGGGYSEMPTIPDLDMAEGGHSSEGSFDAHTYVTDDTTIGEGGEDEEYYTVTDVENVGDQEEGGTEEEKDTEEDESYFSDRNRWKRGGIVDPDANEW